MKQGTFKKFFLTSSAIFLICLTASMTILSVLVGDYMTKDRFESLNNTCVQVDQFVATEYRSGSYRRNIFNITFAVASTNNDLILVADRLGNVVSCTCEDYQVHGACEHSRSGLSSEFLKMIPDGSVYNAITQLDGFLSETCFVSATRVKSTMDNGVVGYVLTAYPSSQLATFYRKMVELYIFSAIVPLVITFFALFALSRRMTKPLTLMSEAAKAMAQGNFSKRIPVQGRDEIAALCESFNQMSDALEELERLRRGFVANVSHELKTPMTTIDGFITGILDGTIPEEKRQDYLERVSGEVKRLSRVVEGMLSLSKLEAGETKLKPESFDLTQLILQVVFSQEQRIEKRRLQLEGLDALEPCPVFADRDLLYQAIYNLWDNAVKFTDEGGRVTVTLTQSDGRLDLRIRNTGQGIPQDNLPYVFDRFYKGDQARSQVKDSTGLGLYLVKTIVKIHGGEVFVSSVEQQYTEFGLSLPILLEGEHRNG